MDISTNIILTHTIVCVIVWLGAAYALNVHRDHVKRVAIVDFGEWWSKLKYPIPFIDLLLFLLVTFLSFALLLLIIILDCFLGCRMSLVSLSSLSCSLIDFCYLFSFDTFKQPHRVWFPSLSFSLCLILSDLLIPHAQSHHSHYISHTYHYILHKMSLVHYIPSYPPFSALVPLMHSLMCTLLYDF